MIRLTFATSASVDWPRLIAQPPTAGQSADRGAPQFSDVVREQRASQTGTTTAEQLPGDIADRAALLDQEVAIEEWCETIAEQDRPTITSRAQVEPAVSQAWEPIPFTIAPSVTESGQDSVDARIVRRLECAGTFCRDASGNPAFGLAFSDGPLAGVRMEIAAVGPARISLRVRTRSTPGSRLRCDLSDLVERLEARGLTVEDLIIRQG